MDVQQIKSGFDNVKKHMEEEDVFFRDLMHHGKHLDVLKFLLGNKPLLDTTGFEDSSVGYFDKQEDETIGPHPDSDNGATIWISLDPTRPDNGCVHYFLSSRENQDDLPYL